MVNALIFYEEKKLTDCEVYRLYSIVTAKINYFVDYDNVKKKIERHSKRNHMSSTHYNVSPVRPGISRNKTKCKYVFVYTYCVGMCESTGLGCD